MKVCGYCNNEYNDAEPKCPVCGSTLLKHNKHSDPAEAELKRIKDEIERKRKSRSLIIGIGAAVIVLAIVIAIFSIVGYVTDPQRDIAKESKELLAQAEHQIDNKNYDAAIDTLDQINPEWDDYSDVEALRVEAVRSQLTTKVAEYQSVGNYQGIITFIKENVADINADSEIKTAYNDAVQKYVTAVIAEADEYLGAGNYNSARTVLNTAVALVGEDANITAKLAEIDNAEILATIAEYESSGDYVSLVSYLQGVAATDANYSALLNQYTQTLVEYILAKAQSYADKRQFGEAIQVIESIRSVCDCSEFQNAISVYEASLPRNLSECYVVEKIRVEIGIEQTDSFGTNHSSVIGLKSDTEGYAVFNLDGKFVKLSGTFMHSDYKYSTTGYLKIYADGKLIYESTKIEKTTTPLTVNVDVTGAKQLCVEFDASSWDPGAIFLMLEATVS